MSSAEDDPGFDVPLTPEVMDQPGADIVPLATRSAIDAAAAAALTDPGIPGRDDFLAMAAMARMLSLSPMAPKHIRGEPYNAFLILLTARDLGISVTYALRKIVPIEGVPSIPPELQRAMVRRKSLGDVVADDANDTQEVPMFARARAVDPDGQPLGPWATFTWQDAQIAELVDARCESPAAHTLPDGRSLAGHVVADCTATVRGQTKRWKGCYCKDNWRKYPRRMLWQRVQGYVVRDSFPEATLGLYTPDELGVITDEQGFAIDVATVELPPGYADPVVAQQQQADQQAAQQDARNRPADGAALWELQLRIRALPDALQEELAEKWKAEDCNLRGWRAAVLPRRLLGNAQAMVNAFEAKAKQGGLDVDAARADVLAELARAHLALMWPTAAQPAQDSPEPASSPDGAAEASEADSEPQGPQPEGDGTPAEAGEPEPDDGKDWAEIAKNIATRVRAEAQGVPNETVIEITQQLKALHHSKVNAELREAGVPTDGPIDLRRMHAALLRLRAWKLAQDPPQGLAGDPDPVAVPEPAADAALCEHGAALGYCTEHGCAHEKPF